MEQVNLVLSEKKTQSNYKSEGIDFLSIALDLCELMDDKSSTKEVLAKFARILIAKTPVERFAVFKCGKVKSKFYLQVDSKTPGMKQVTGEYFEFKKQSKKFKEFTSKKCAQAKVLFRELKLKSSTPEWAEVFSRKETYALPISCNLQSIKGMLVVELADHAEMTEELDKFLMLIAKLINPCMDESAKSDSQSIHKWLLNEFSYPVFLVDAKTKKILKANQAVESVLSDNNGDDVSPASLISLVDSVVSKVNSINPLVWSKGYLPNLWGDFYIIASKFGTANPDCVFAAVVPADDKHWDFLGLLSKLSSGNLAAEAATKQLYWDRLMRQVVTRLHTTLDYNIVLQLLVDNMGQCLNASRCLFIQTANVSSMVVSHEYSDPSISPLGFGRTARFPSSVVNLFRKGPMALSDVTALRSGSTISSADVSNMLNAGVNSMAGAPVVCNGVLYGVLIVIEMGDNRDWTSNEMEMIRLATRHAAIALELCIEHQKVKDQLYHASTSRKVDTPVLQPASGKGEKRARALDQSATKALSERELEVLRLIASGLSNKEIAGRLFLTASTVELHASRMRKKLKMKSRTQLVKYACDHGLV